MDLFCQRHSKNVARFGVGTRIRKSTYGGGLIKTLLVE